jgi:streptogramin lyase
MMPSVQNSVQRAGHVRIREFNDLLAGSAYYTPSAIANGPEGDLWTTEDIDQDYGECAVVQVAPSGARLNVFYYGGVTSEGASFAGIAEGSDGALWITDEYNEQILRMTTDGTYTSYPLRSGASFPQGIAAGPDGALWFVGSHDNAPAVGRITTSGKFTFFSSGITSGAYLQNIAVGPDGAMWFTEPTNNKVGRITMHGKITEYSSGISAGAFPYSITAGPDKALWFTELLGGRIGRITTKGAVTEYSKGITATEEPNGIALGSDNALWFTETEVYGSYHYRDARIGRIAPPGAIHEYSGISDASNPTSIVAGPKNKMWFVESATDELGRLQP